MRALSPADIAYLANVPNLLVAMDFDGTLAHFSTDPYQCRAVEGSFDALHSLSAISNTSVMVISGRNVELLSAVTEIDPAHAAKAATGGDGIIRLVGSHGAEPADQPMVNLSDPQRELLGQLAHFAETQAQREPGIWVERKPFSVGLHTRAAKDRSIALDAAGEYRAFAQDCEGAKVTMGKDIVEVAVVSMTKGKYLSTFLERAVPAMDAVVFAGDDTTDETVMSMLRPGQDIGIKVGEGESAATRRVETPEDIRDFLVQLAAARQEWAATQAGDN